MRQHSFLFYVVIIIMVFIFNGCLSVSNSPVPKFYMLRAIDNATESKKFNISSKTIIGIGPIEIPEYQNRPQIVTRDKEGMLNFAQFERWGESLDAGLARLILENLTVMLPQAEFQIFPCNFSIPLDYQVIINVVQLESQLDKEVFLAIQWTIVDTKTKGMLLTKRSEIYQAINPHTYFGLAQALSKACASLSREIAESLSKLSIQPETKDILVQ
ncbi:MAG: PqiC family protein [Candidatus Omnitrophica bacterium]|nr:PqiC family protein [Candidatus Omnitrophota bacterium]